MTQALELLPDIVIPKHQLPRMADFAYLGERFIKHLGIKREIF